MPRSVIKLFLHTILYYLKFRWLCQPHTSPFSATTLILEFLALLKMAWNWIFDLPLVVSSCPGTTPCSAHASAIQWTFLSRRRERRRRRTQKSGECVDCGISTTYCIKDFWWESWMVWWVVMRINHMTKFHSSAVFRQNVLDITKHQNINAVLLLLVYFHTLRLWINWWFMQRWMTYSRKPESRDYVFKISISYCLVTLADIPNIQTWAIYLTS